MVVAGEWEKQTWFKKFEEEEHCYDIIGCSQRVERGLGQDKLTRFFVDLPFLFYFKNANYSEAF